VELQALQEAMRLWRRESLVQGAHAMGRKIDGVDAPLRHHCAKVVSLIIT
jgi:hypothetical protein